ncbi:MAG: hypothetical protein GDA36_07845 [Rhodobacteraceae bacterium]|nr:hypothetical protein [Paracoccaceae bacterium]
MIDLLLRKAVDRIGADDVLSKIDAPVDWRWCSPTCKLVLGCFGIGHLQLRLDFMLFCGPGPFCACAR